MNKPRVILACVDFSRCSGHALAEAGRLAKWAGAELHVAHIVLPLVVLDLAGAVNMPVAELENQLMQQATAEMEQFVTERVKGLDAKLHVAVGDAFNELDRIAHDVRADLAVLGVLGAGERGVGAGTVATRCAHSLPCPVLLVTEKHSGPFKRVLAAIDFSQTSLRALERAVSVAACDGSELDVLHVYHAPWHRLHYKSSSEESLPQYREQYTRRLQSHLDSVCESAKAGLPADRVHFHLLDASSVGYGIIDHVRQQHVDLVVLGTRGHSKLMRLLLGSTAERLLRETPCSLLVVKPEA